MITIRHLLNALLLTLVMVAGSIPVHSDSGVGHHTDPAKTACWLVPSAGMSFPVQHDDGEGQFLKMARINHVLQIFHGHLLQQVIFLFMQDEPSMLSPVEPAIQLLVRPPVALVLFRHFISRQAP